MRKIFSGICSFLLAAILILTSGVLIPSPPASAAEQYAYTITPKIKSGPAPKAPALKVVNS